jgi:hypothetical protein
MNPGDRGGSAGDGSTGRENGVYRAPMRARDRDADPFAGSRSCVARELVGTGDPLARTPDDLDEAVILAGEEHGEKAARMLDRFACLPDGSVVWTRTDEDVYRLGRICGPWRYDDSREASETGIHHVRPCEWVAGEFGPVEAPDAVIATFDRGGRNFQRIRDDSARLDSTALLNRR